MKQINLLATMLVFQFGCASPGLSVRSTPEGADVTFVPIHGPALSLGKTPLIITPAMAPGLFKRPGQIQVTKQGFLTQGSLIPDLGQLGGSGELQFALNQSELPKICQAQEDLANTIAQGVAEASSLVQRKRYAEAAQQLQQLIGKYPRVATFYDLKGNIFYLMRDFAGALDAFRVSDELAPSNPATRRMIERIEGLQSGVR